MTAGGLVVAEESPLQDDVRALIAELNDALIEMEPETPEEFVFRMTAEEMARPDTTVWVARRNGDAVGCGALRRLGDGLGEVKRMYVRPAARGSGAGAAILSAIETKARQEGLSALALETGLGFAAAHRVYERGGFSRCGPFADYIDGGYTAFYSKTLARPVEIAGRPVPTAQET